MANDPNRSGQGPEVADVKHRIERETEAARQSAQHVGENVQRQAKEMSADLQAQAQQLLADQKEMAKSGLMDMVSAIRRAADDLEEHQQGQLANVVRNVAGGIESFSQSIGRRNFQDMLSDVQRFARDHPTAFFGGAVLLGLAVARFAKSSSQHSRTGAEQGSLSYGIERAEQPGQPEFTRHEGEQSSRFVETGATR